MHSTHSYEPSKPLGAGVPLLGSLPSIARGALPFFMRVLREEGDRVRLRIPGRRVLLLCHPDDIESVLVRDRDAYGRSAELRALGPLFGRGLLASEGDLWRRQRTSIAPSFRHDALATYSAIMLATIERHVATWRAGETRDVHADMMRYTRETICSVLFGTGLGDDGRALGEAVTTVFGELRSEILFLPVWRLLPTRRSRAWNRAVAFLNRTIRSIVRDRRRSAESHADLLDALLRARDASGNGMTDRQIHDEIMTFFLAGHETAAVSLTWACHLLADRPELQEKIRDEVRAVANGRPLAPSDQSALRFTTATIKEALRLYPPVWSMGRRAIADTKLGDDAIRSGTDIWICLYRTHRDPRWYAEPDRFSPERWLENDSAKPFTYLPFGIGPRVCIGQHFAMTEAVLGLAAIASRFRLQRSDDAPVEPSGWITLRPKQRISLELVTWR